MAFNNDDLIRICKREIAIIEARDNFKRFCELMMPNIENELDSDQTMFVTMPHHQVIIDMVEDIESGKSVRSALSVPPQNGKTQITSIFGAAWILGRNTTRKIIIGTYSLDRAKKVGSDIRKILTSDAYREVFPDFELSRGSKAKEFMATEDGGYVLLAGRGTGVTGQPCDFCFVDDPIKDMEEAVSPTTLASCWDWYCSVLMARFHTLTRVMIIHTRWAENDLIGRLCDPSHPEYDADKAGRWTYINLPVFVDDPELAKALGLEVGDVLWEAKFSRELLEEARKNNPTIFSALYMGKPVPDEGSYFTKSMISNYVRSELPENLRIYAGSDHAVRTGQDNDFTVMVVVGIDEKGVMWVLDCVKRKIPVDVQVEEMIRLMVKYKPITWWAGRDHISGSIAPFLSNRMKSAGIYSTYIDELPERGDKKQKAQSIRGMMALAMVKFPVDQFWYQDCINELLKFDKGLHDDFVDAMANIGRGLDKIFSARGQVVQALDTLVTGTIGWVKRESKLMALEKNRKRELAGW